MYTKRGIKLVVSSFFGFIRNQEKNGGQSLEVLGNSAKVDCCFPNILNCQRTIDAMALDILMVYKTTSCTSL